MEDNVGIVNEALIVGIGCMVSRRFVNAKQETGLNSIDWSTMVVDSTGSWNDEQ